MPRGSLNEVRVKKIKRDLKAGKSQTLIAKEHGVSQVMITHIKARRVWKHVKL